MTPKVNVEAIMEAQRYLSDPKNKKMLEKCHYSPSMPIVAVEESETVKSVFERVSATGADTVLLCVLYPNRNAFKGRLARIVVMGFSRMAEGQCEREHPNEDVLTSSKLSHSEIGLLVSYIKRKPSHAVVLTELALKGNKSMASLAMATC